MSGELITLDGQAQYGTLLMGPGTPYRIAPAGLRGWDDLPPLDSADVPRPSADGYWPGTIYAAERVIETDLNMFTGDPALWPAAMTALRAATAPGAEQPLVIRLGGQLLQCGVRCTGRLGGADGYTLGADRVSLRWTASDPRRYSINASSATTNPPATGAGITWPVTWPLTWPAATSGGNIFITNGGDWATPVLITISGPLTTPAVYRLDTGDVIELNVTLGAADTAVIDTLAGTVSLNGAVNNTLLTDRSAPIASFLMPPGSTGLAIRAAVMNSSASITAVWRSAYL